MRLIPPAGSSDLEQARAIARRLERASAAPAAPPAASAKDYARIRTDRSLEPPQAAAARASEAATPPPVAPVAETSESSIPPGAPIPVAVETPAEAATRAEALGWPEDAPVDTPAEALPVPAETEAALPVPAETPFEEAGLGEAPGWAPDAPPETPAEAALEATEPAVEPVLAEESPLDALDQALPTPPEEAPPSWDSLLAAAQALAGADAAMVIGPDSALVAASDGWPAAGASAIATKLLPIAAVRLTAPESTVSVKLGLQVLTAWRFEIGSAASRKTGRHKQTFTIALLADRPVPAENRPDIDARLVQGSPSA